MFAEANIIVDSKKGLAILKEALLKEENKNFVLLLKDNKDGIYSFQKIAVNIGATSEDYVELLPDNQINEKSIVLTKGVYDVTN